MKRLCLALCLLLVFTGRAQQKELHLVFTSDAHFGLKRSSFRGKDSVSSYLVNKALIEAVNSLPNETLPGSDSKKIGWIDYLIEGGDIANRQEIPIQSAAVSWQQFLHCYRDGLHTKAANGKQTKLVALPGNHDISNAIGFYKPMLPLHDATAMAGLYNMMATATKVTAVNYNYASEKVNHSFTLHGIHFMFLNLWPDSANRVWLEKDLLKIGRKTPVILFTHDQPESEGKHFTNPYGRHDINAADKYENLLVETHKDNDVKNTDVEQREWCAFLTRHPNIKAYFHGNSNWNEFYDYTGPDKSVNLPVFRVDSPIKGKYSADDETKLSFQFIVIDANAKTMTVHEVFWNQGNRVKWGQSRTIALN